MQISFMKYSIFLELRPRKRYMYKEERVHKKVGVKIVSKCSLRLATNDFLSLTKTSIKSLTVV